MESLSGLFAESSTWLTFLWGFAGSAFVEIVSINRIYDLGSSIPDRYRCPFFWIVRTLLACVGGCLAVAYGIMDNPLLAANVGAATPLIVQALSQGVKSAG
jgi:hypothetical protein